MKTTPTFTPSLFRSFESKLDFEKWDEVMEAHEKGEYKKSLLLLLDYIDSNIREKYTQDGIDFEIPHGSVVIKIQITDSGLKVTCPFLRVTDETKLIPLYRHIAELNFDPLGLPQITLKGKEFTMIYECPLSQCEPFKMYDLFQDICLNADQYDEEFIAKFSAKHIQKPEVKEYDSATLDKAYDKIQEILKEHMDLIDFLEDKRFNNYVWDAINIAFKRIDFYVAPQGRLRSELERNVRVLYSNDSFENKLQKGKQFLSELKNKDKNEIMGALYKVNVFVSAKYRATLDSLRQRWAEAYKTAQKEISDGYSMGACFTMLVALYDVFYYSNIDDAISKKIIRLLEGTAQMTWEKAAPKLLDGMTRIMNDQPMNISFADNFFKRLLG